MGEVVDLDARRPHLVILDADTRNSHVIPVRLALDIASGEVDPGMLPPGVWRTVMLEWLTGLDLSPDER